MPINKNLGREIESKKTTIYHRNEVQVTWEQAREIWDGFDDVLNGFINIFILYFAGPNKSNVMKKKKSIELS